MLDSLMRRVERTDGWQNIATSLGIEGLDHRLQTKFIGRLEATADELDQLYEQNAYFARIVDAIPFHATRRWIKLVPTGEDVDRASAQAFGSEALEFLDGLKARERFAEWLKFERLYGGSVMLPGFDDGQSLDKPLNAEAIRAVTHITVVSKEEVSGLEWDDDPASPTYGQAKMIQLLGSTQRIHTSRVFMRHGVVASRRRLRERAGWGASIRERVWDQLRRFGTLFDYIEGLFKDMTQGVITIPGLDKILATEEGEDLIKTRIRLMNYSASIFNAIVINEGETYEKRQVTFSGLAEATLRAMDELAGAAEMPQTILFGQSPGGLSTDDTSGMRNFYDSIANVQRVAFEDPISALVDAGMQSGQLKTAESYRVEYLPLEEPSDTEVATTENTRAKTDETLIMNDVIKPLEARRRVRNDPKSPYTLDADEEISNAPEPDPNAPEDPNAPPEDMPGSAPRPGMKAPA